MSHLGEGVGRRLERINMLRLAGHQQRHVTNARSKVVANVARLNHAVDGVLHFPFVGPVDVGVRSVLAGGQLDAAHRTFLNGHDLVLD